MAGYFSKTLFSALKHMKLCKRTLSFSARRYLLTEAYSCQEAWMKRLDSPILHKVSLNEFAIQLRDKFEKVGKTSVVDIDIFANKLHEMEMDDAEFMEDILQRFRQSPDSVPVNDSIVYAVVRAYIDLNLTDRLVALMKDKWTYGIFPNVHAVNFLFDQLIKQNNYQDAAEVAYEMMLQEDFSHPLTNLLSLYSCVKYYSDINLDPPPEPEVIPDEEEDWIPVPVIRYLIYDDHFDIKDERFLMGKTLYALGKHNPDALLSRSLQFMGLGIYQKFDKALKLLENWEKSQEVYVVLEEALLKFEESLVKAETRGADEPEKDFGLRTMEDEIRKVRITQEDKEKYMSQFQDLKSKIKDRITNENLQNIVETLVKSQVLQHEEIDIKTQTELFASWNEERETHVKTQIWEYTRKQKEAEIQNKLKELQEKEEMLNFFELRDKIIMAKKIAPKEKVVIEEEDEDILLAKRMKRRKHRGVN